MSLDPTWEIGSEVASQRCLRGATGGCVSTGAIFRARVESASYSRTDERATYLEVNLEEQICDVIQSMYLSIGLIIGGGVSELVINACPENAIELTGGFFQVFALVH